MNTTTLIDPSATAKAQRQASPSNNVDLAHGAQHFGIHPYEICIQADILEDYAEIDRSPGLNVVGAILAVLACRLAAQPVDSRNDMISAYLVRRDDGRLVELDLHLSLISRSGRESIVLSKADEREIELQIG
jgi:hypothetical protein